MSCPFRIRLYTDAYDEKINKKELYTQHKHPSMPEMSAGPRLSFEPNHGRHREISYADWAFAGSAEKALLSSKCIPRGSKFEQMYRPPHANSNRSFVLELSLGGHKSSDSYASNLGNEFYAVDEEHPLGRKGYISTGILMIRQFIEIMRPFVEVKEVRNDVKDQEDLFKINLAFVLKFKGVFEVKEVLLESPDSNGVLTEDIAPNKYFSTFSEGKRVTVNFEGSEKRISYNDPETFVFKFEADEDWTKRRGSEACSLFVRGKADKQYSASMGQYVYRSAYLRGLEVSNLIVNQLKDYLVYSRGVGFAQLFYDTKIVVSIGTYFPIILVYDRDTLNVHFEVNEDYLPEPLPLSKYIDRNVSADFGLLSHQLGVTKNAEIRGALNDFKYRKDFLSILVLKSNKIGEKRDLEMKEDMKKLSTRKLDLVNQLNNRLAMSGTIMFRLKYGEQTRILPSIFMDLIGRKIRVILSSDPGDLENVERIRKAMRSYSVEENGDEDSVKGRLLGKRRGVLYYFGEIIEDGIRVFK